LQLLVSAIDRTESGLPSAFPDRFWNAIRHLSNDEWYEGIQLVSSYCRVFCLLVAILVGLAAAGWDDAPAAAIVWEPVATLEDPDVDPVSPKHRRTPILPPRRVPNATVLSLWHILPFEGPRAAQRFAFSLRIPRAPPVELLVKRDEDTGSLQCDGSGRHSQREGRVRSWKERCFAGEENAMFSREAWW